MRFSGDTRKHAHAQAFAWEAYEKGVDVHILAEPTKLEMLQRVYDTKKEEYKANVQDSVVEKYGGVEHLQAPPRALLLAQTEDYVEYSRYGKVIKVNWARGPRFFQNKMSGRLLVFLCQRISWNWLSYLQYILRKEMWQICHVKSFFTVRTFIWRH